MLSGKHIYPGMIASNTVIGIAEVQSVRATANFAEAGAINPECACDRFAVNPDSGLIPVTRVSTVFWPHWCAECRSSGHDQWHFVIGCNSMVGLGKI